ncbi:MAG: hypothetical protein ACE5IO_09720 [Thermoplasmata archaeon]
MKLHVEANKVTVATKSKYPFLEEDLDRKCKAAGFTVPKRGGTVLIAARDGSQSLGQVWSADDKTITYDPNRGFLSLESRDLSETAQGFATLIDIARELLSDTFEEEIRWGELNFAARVSSETLPLEVLSGSSTKVHEELSKLFEEPLSPFSIAAYSSPGEDLKRPLNEVPNWFDMRIEPLIANPRYYFVRIVYRKQDLARISGFLQGLEDRLGNVIQLLEES